MPIKLFLLCQTISITKPPIWMSTCILVFSEDLETSS